MSRNQLLLACGFVCAGLLAGCGERAAVDPVTPDGGSVDGNLPLVPTRLSCVDEWRDVQLGTELDDEVWGLTFDDDQNLYVSGFEHGLTGVTNIEPDGDSRGVVLRIDPTGAVKWKALLDTAGTDTVEDVAIDPASGAIYAVGRTSGAFTGFVNQGQFDTFLAAIDAHGQPTRIFQSGDERPQHPTRLALGADHDVAIAGYDDTYIPSNFVESWEDGFVAGFDRGAPTDAAFTQQFLQKVPNKQANRVTGVAVDRDGSGSIYVTSYVSAGASVGNFVKKLNRDGSLVWSTRVSGLPEDAVNAVGLSPANELFVAGATFQALGDASFGQEDAFIMKVDRATGAIIWAAQGGSADSDYATALAFDDAGNVYVAGYTVGSVVAGAANQGGIDVFALKFDARGAWRTAWQSGTTDDDFATSLAVDRCGRAFVGGYAHGAFAKTSAGSAGGYDMFVVRAAL